MRVVFSTLSGNYYMPVNTTMPADSITTERYIVYSSDGSNDDTKSIKSGRSDSITFRDPTYVDLTCAKQASGTTSSLSATSPVPSTITTDKWSSYWSKRERCCCFWNFLLTVTLVVLITIVVLATKGMVSLKPVNNTGDTAADQYQGNDVMSTTPTITCTTQKPVEPEVCTDSKCAWISADILTYMNISADPCEDFYTYACGGFMERSQLSWNSPRKRINPDIIYHKHIETLADGLSEEINTVDGAEFTAIKRVFKSCTEFTGSTTEQLLDVMGTLGGFEFGNSVKTKELDLTQLTIQSLLKYGVSPLFDMDINTDGKIALFNRYSDSLWSKLLESGVHIHRYRFLKPSDFIYRDENNDELLMSYKTYMGNFIAHIIGINETERADQRFMALINDVYHLNVYMNRVFYSEDVLNPFDEVYQCRSPSDLNELQYHYSYNISWRTVLTTLFKNTSFLHNKTVCFTSLSNSVNDVLSGFPPITIKRYFIFYALTQSDLFYLLPSAIPRFSTSQWSHSALIDDGSAFPDYSCARQISKHLPMHYVIANHISKRFNDALRQMFIELITSIEGIIRDLYWMPIKQKKHLLTELSGLTMQLEWENANDTIKEYIPEITDNYFRNMLLMIRYETGQILRGRAKHTITESYSSVVALKNKVLVVVPLSALQMPFTYAEDVYSIWYGTVGTYLAQTISQLLDIDALLRLLSEGKLDHRVALTIAWRLQCLHDEYSKYRVLEQDSQSHFIQSDLTKSANFKDSLALRVVYNAYQKNKQVHRNIPGFPFTDDQLFFISYAQSMCEKTNVKGTFKYYIDTDVTHHSPGKYRVLGSLSHYKKFADAFQCSENAALNPVNKCTLF